MEFEYDWDKARIMEGKPWLCDGILVSSAEFDGLTPPAKMPFEKAAFWVRMFNLPLACMGKETSQKIGTSVGRVEDVDVDDDEPGWGEYLRVKIELDLSKPLARGRKLYVQNKALCTSKTRPFG